MTDSAVIEVASAVVVTEGKHTGKIGVVASVAKGWFVVSTNDELIKLRLKQLAFHVEQEAKFESDEEELSDACKMAKALRDARTGYEKATTVLGKATMDSGDQLAIELRTMPLIGTMILSNMVVQPLLHGTGKSYDAFKQYGHLNEGQRRMNSGNKIRGAIKRGETTIEEVLGLVPDAKEKANEILAQAIKDQAAKQD